MSLFHVLKGLQVPKGCAKTLAVSGGCGLDRDTEEPPGGAEGRGEGAPPWAVPWAGPGSPLAKAAQRRRGQMNEARSCSPLQVLSPREAPDAGAAEAATAVAAVRATIGKPGS